MLYQGKFHGKIDPELTRLVAAKLLSAVKEGYGKEPVNISYDTPDANMLDNLERNVYQFAAAKNYKQLQAMTLALKDGKGGIRPFSDFRKVANHINRQFNDNWLKTEYNTAIASGQMASRWVDFQRNAEAMPNLKYKTVEDDRVRISHKDLNGVIRAMNDSFWDVYYPPNGYNCRCDVIQVPDNEKVTSLTNKKLPAVPEMFRVNLAKRGLAFPPKHAYYNGIPEEVFKEIEKTVPKISVSQNKKDFDNLNDNEYPRSWKKYFKESDGYYATHKDHSRGNRGKEILTSDILASVRGEVVILKPEPPHKKSNDALRNNVDWEFKSIKNATNLKGAIQSQAVRSIGQCNKVLIHINMPKDKFKTSELSDGAYLFFKNKNTGKYIKIIQFLLNDGTLYEYKIGDNLKIK